MDYLIAFLLFTAAAGGGIISNIIASELYDRAPSFARYLVNRSVLGLPDNERDRYKEEWLAHLDELPGSLSKLRHGLSCYFRAARGIARAMAERSKSGDDLDRSEAIAKWILLIYCRFRFGYVWLPFLARGRFSIFRKCVKLQDFIFGSLLDQLIKAEKANKTPDEVAQIVRDWRTDMEQRVARARDKVASKASNIDMDART